MAELVGCDPVRLDDVSWLADRCVEACRLAGATVLGVQQHKFAPQGASALVLLAESHLSIHTWPEHGYASVDIYTCGHGLHPRRAVRHLAACLEASKTLTLEIERGRHRLGADGRARFEETVLRAAAPEEASGPAAAAAVGPRIRVRLEPRRGAG